MTTIYVMYEPFSSRSNFIRRVSFSDEDCGGMNVSEFQITERQEKIYFVCRVRSYIDGCPCCIAHDNDILSPNLEDPDSQGKPTFSNLTYAQLYMKEQSDEYTKERKERKEKREQQGIPVEHESLPEFFIQEWDLVGTDHGGNAQYEPINLIYLDGKVEQYESDNE